MLELLLGIVCGIALSLFFSFGPAFFSQIRTSIQYGFRKSYPFAFGVSAGDVVIVALMLTVLKNADLYGVLHNVWVASIGGAVMVFMGIYFFRKKVHSLETIEENGPRIKFRNADGDPRRRTIFFQGFLINFVNPTIWIYWISVITLVTGELNLTIFERYVFFIGVLGTTLAMDTLKCKLASMLQRIITARVINVSNRVCGVILFAFAAYLVVSMVRFQTHPEEGEPDQKQTVKSTEMIKNLHNRLDSNLAHGQIKHLSSDTVQCASEK